MDCFLKNSKINIFGNSYKDKQERMKIINLRKKNANTLNIRQ